MTIQRLLDAYPSARAHHDVNPPATEAQIQAAEAKIGAQLPSALREIYLLFNGGWAWELDFFPLAPPTQYEALTHSNEQFIEDGWPIPQEIRLFAATGAESFFGIWLPPCGNPIYNHPVIEVGGPYEDSMGVAGTNLLSFLRGWSAFYLVGKEEDALWAVKLGEDKDAPNRLKRIQTALDALQVPQSLRTEHQQEDCEENDAQLRKWADPQLPDPYVDPDNLRYTIADLKRIFSVS